MAKDKKEQIIIGIDLGTTNTLAAYVEKGRIKPIKFPGGNMLPSVLYVEEDGSVIVGKQAAKKLIFDPKNGIRSAKTYMGDFDKKYIVRGKKYTPTDVATEVLKEVKKAVLKNFKMTAEEAEINALITVPAYFNMNQKDETIKAGERAGLKVLGTFTEPSSAAIDSIRTLELEDANVFVVDLGGGTFDISVLKAEKQGYEPIAVGGDRHLGGDDFDKRIRDYIFSYVEGDLGIDLSSQAKSGLSYKDYYMMEGQIEEEAKRAKVELSDEEEYEILIPNLFEYNNKPYDLELIITREKFYALASDLFVKVQNCIKEMFTKHPELLKRRITAKNIDNIVLAGGSCYIPKVQADVEKIFAKEAETADDRSTMVVRGAALKAADIYGFVTDPSSQTNPVDVDVTSHSFGVAVYRNNKMELAKIIPAGTKYPTRPGAHKKNFTTVYDFQDTVTIEVYESADGKENEPAIEKNGKLIHDFYGSFDLTNIQKALKGVPNIEVSFSIGFDSRLTVIAEDMKTHSKKEVKIAKGERAVTSYAAKAVDMVLLMDGSSSMNFDNKMNDAKKAANKLVDEILDLSVHRLAVGRFANDGIILCSLQQDKEELKRKISVLKGNGCTNMGDGIEKACIELSESHNEKYIVIVSDGNPYTSKGDAESMAKRAAQKAKDAGIKIAAVGVGRDGDVDFELLKTIASPTMAYKIRNMDKLAEVFETIITHIAEK